MKRRAIVFCAHSDDEAVGCSGTMLRLLSEGYHLTKVVFSYGEMSHPHLKKAVATKQRIQETGEISKKYGISDTIFFNLTDSKIRKEVSSKATEERISGLLKGQKQEKVFIPSAHDPHPDHRAVHEVIVKFLKKGKYKGEILCYEVWNLTEKNIPCVYIDITQYYQKKLQMMRDFKSQWFSMYALLLPVRLRSRRYGKKISTKYAEKFYKLQ